MKVLFFNPEQYLSFENEPSNYELRLPMIHCGVVTEYRDYIYQRVMREHGREQMDAGALEIVREFQPDIIVYSTTWPHMLLSDYVLHKILDEGYIVYTHMWDTQIRPHDHEYSLLASCTYFGLWDSITNYRRYLGLALLHENVKGVICPVGFNSFPDLMKKEPGMTKEYDVTILGSNEGKRAELRDFLEGSLESTGAKFYKFGGLVDSRRVTDETRFELTDDWVSWEDYVDVINKSKIGVVSQTQSHRLQIKGKVFDFLACGSFCLCDYNDEMRQIVPFDCIEYYRDEQDCLDKALYYLEHETEREEVAARGHRWFKSTFDALDFWNRFFRFAVNGEGTLPEPRLIGP